jgi:hypothetical protein
VPITTLDRQCGRVARRPVDRAQALVARGWIARRLSSATLRTACDIRERLNASFYYAFKLLGRFSLRKIYSGLHGCEDILGSVLGFQGKCGDMLIAALSIRDVPGDFRGAYDLALSISDRRDRQRNVNKTTVSLPKTIFEHIDGVGRDAQ